MNHAEGLPLTIHVEPIQPVLTMALAMRRLGYLGCDGYSRDT